MTTLKRAILIATAVVCGAHPAAAQGAEGKVTVDLGTADGPPGTTISVPVNIAVPENTTVAALELDVRFEKEVLSFTRADLAPQGKADGLELTTSVEDDPDDKSRSILRVTAAGAKPLSSGAVADLSFQINPDAKPPTGSTGHTAAKFTAVLQQDARVRIGEETMAVAEGRDGQVDVTEGVALFGCFFYMH